MFTGLIEAVGRVGGISRAATGLRIAIQTDMAADLADGESVSVNGVCLTVSQRDATGFSADIGPETARVTTLGSVQAEQPVNLERAMAANGRFGGHFVQGHVDGIGTIRDVRVEGDARWLKVAFPPELAPFFVPKGSVALDGVSLTVAALGPDHFDVMIIPFTWGHTNLSGLQAGSPVNLECDVVGKYVARAVQLFGS
ncbi:MAG: riboflavin synthase [Vicinamibacterales bacterium]